MHRTSSSSSGSSPRTISSTKIDPSSTHDDSVSGVGNDAALMRRSGRASAPPEKHPCIQASNCWNCLGGVTENDNGDVLVDLSGIDGGDSEFPSVSEAVSGDNDVDATGAVMVPLPSFTSHEIADLKTALTNESKHWSNKYNVNHADHDPQFKLLIDAYVHEQAKFSAAIDKGTLSPKEILDTSNKLGTLLMRAYGLADQNGWTETTHLCMRDSGEAYATPSRTTNWFNMTAGIMRGVALTSVATLGAAAGAAPLTLLYAGSAINFTYVGVQLGFSVMLPLQNAGAQSAAVARQAQWGPLYMPNLLSSKCVNRQGGEFTLVPKQKLQTELQEMKRLKALYGQVTCDQQTVIDAKERSEIKRDAARARIEKRIQALKERLHKAQNAGADIGGSGKAVLAADDPLVALDAAQKLTGTAYSPSAKWFSRTSKALGQYQVHDAVVKNLDAALTQATTNDGGIYTLDEQALAVALSNVPEAVTGRMNALAWELATVDRYETLNVLTNQGHSRTVRNALNLMAALFSMVGNTEDWGSVEEDTRALIQELTQVGAELAQEAAKAGAEASGLAAMAQYVQYVLNLVPNIWQGAIESKWEVLSWLTLVAQPCIYQYTQGVATAFDQENKLATQAQIMALTNLGQIVKGDQVNPAGLDAAMKGSMKTRMEHFKAALEFDSKVYSEAMWSLLADEDHITTAQAATAVIAKDDTGESLEISCTFTGLSTAFAACKSPDERGALIGRLANARQLTDAKKRSLQVILELYEKNLVNIDHVGKNNLEALLGPGSTLPPQSQVMLGGALRYAMVPKHLPTTDSRHDSVQKYLKSAEGRKDAEMDDLLATKKGQVERFTNTAGVNQATQKIGQTYAWGLAGSGGPTTIKALTTLVSEVLRMMGGYQDIGLNRAALGVKLAGNAVSIVGSAAGIFLGYAYHKYILLKNLHRQRDVKLKIPSVANSAVLSVQNRDFMTLLSMDRLRGQVTNYGTLAAERIPEAALPASLESFKSFVLSVLPAFLGQAQAGDGPPVNLDQLPPMKYESKTSFIADMKEQMTAASLREIFTYFMAEPGGLAEISDEDIKDIVNEVIAAIAERLESQGSEKTEDDESVLTSHELIEFEDPESPVTSSEINAAMTMLQDIGFLTTRPLPDADWNERVQSTTEFVGNNRERLNTLRQTARALAEAIRQVNAGSLPGVSRESLIQADDMLTAALRQLDVDRLIDNPNNSVDTDSSSST